MKLKFATIALAGVLAAVAHADADVYTAQYFSASWTSSYNVEFAYNNNEYYNDNFGWGGLYNSGGYYTHADFGFTIGSYTYSDLITDATDPGQVTSLVENQTEYIFYNQSNTPGVVTFNAYSYALGESSVTDNVSGAAWQSSSFIAYDGVINGVTNPFVTLSGVSGDNNSGFQFDNNYGSMTVVVDPDTEIVFVGRTEGENIVEAGRGSVVPGPAAVIPFGIGLLGAMRRKRTR
jgi:hypothetical protein